MRRIILLFTAAAMMAVLLAMSAGPALAKNKHHDRDRDRDFFVIRNNDGFEFSGPNFDDQELESGEIETETDISIEGNNNNQCVGALQFGQTGNIANQQGTSEFGDGGFGHGGFFVRDDNDNNNGDNEFRGPDVTFSPENETACDQGVEQAAAASSWGWSSWW